MLTLFAHIYDFSLLHSPQMTQPPGAVVKAATDGRVSKGGFLPTGAWFVPVGARIKREYLEENVKIQGRQAATARRWMGVPLRNRRRYTAVHLFS